MTANSAIRIDAPRSPFINVPVSMVQRCPLVPAIGDTLAGAATSFEVWIWGVSSSKIPKLCPSVATSDQVRSPDFGLGSLDHMPEHRLARLTPSACVQLPLTALQ